MDITVENYRGKGFVFGLLRDYINDYPGAAVLSDIVCSLRNERGRRVAVLDRHLPGDSSIRTPHRRLCGSFTAISVRDGLGVPHLRKRKQSTAVDRLRIVLTAKHRHIRRARSRNLFLVTRLPHPVFEAREKG